MTVDNAGMAKKAEYFYDLVDADGLTNLRDTAKMIGIPPIKFFQWLLKHRYVYRDSRSKLPPVSEYNPC